MNDTFQAEWVRHDQEIKAYLWSHRFLNIGKNILGLTLLYKLLVNFRFFNWDNKLANWGGPLFLQWLIYFACLAMAWELLTLPFLLGHHMIERSYALSKQSYLNWFWDKIKAYFVGGVLGALILWVFYFGIGIFQENWWWATSFFLTVFSVVLAQLAPIIFIPLFFKLAPLEAGELKDRLFKLCERKKVVVKDIFHLGLGDKTEKGNAAFVGLGKTKKIMIGDTLYKKFSIDEVEAVFAHELGHQVHQDIWKGIALSSIFLFLGFFLANYIASEIVLPWFATDLSRPFGLFLFFICLTLVQMPMGVLQSLYSRNREWSADKFAEEEVGCSRFLADALEKLTFQNRGLFKPNAIWEFLTYSHPAPARRILALRKRKN